MHSSASRHRMATSRVALVVVGCILTWSAVHAQRAGGPDASRPSSRAQPAAPTSLAHVEPHIVDAVISGVGGVSFDDDSLHFHSSRFQHTSDRLEMETNVRRFALASERAAEMHRTTVKGMQQTDVRYRAAVADEEATKADLRAAQEQLVMDKQLLNELETELGEAGSSALPEVREAIQAQDKVVKRSKTALSEALKRADRATHEVTLSHAERSRAQSSFDSSRQRSQRAEEEHAKAQAVVLAAERAEERRRAEAPFPPFAPHGEQEFRLVVIAAIRHVADAAARDSGVPRPRPYVTPAELEQFVLAVLNPDGAEVSEAEVERVRQALDDFRGRSGLTPEAEQRLTEGYLARGHCLRFLRALNDEMRAAREAAGGGEAVATAQV